MESQEGLTPDCLLSRSCALENPADIAEHDQKMKAQSPETTGYKTWDTVQRATIYYYYYYYYYLLPTTYYLLPTTYYLLPTTYYLLPTTYQY